jgi:hypothetical protein
MRELKEDYLINALALVFDATLRASLYDFNMGNYTTKKLYESLLNEIIEVQAYIEDPDSINALVNIVGLTLNRPLVK